MRKPVKAVTISVERDGWTGALQLSVNDESGGFRLCGPKFNGSSTPVLIWIADERGADALRRYLDAAFPPRRALSQAEGGAE